MGNPVYFYKMYLREFLTILKEVDKENIPTDIKLLEDEVLKIKTDKDERIFYMFAGISIERVNEDVNKNYGNDGLNASIGGINEFLDLIEIYDL